MGNIMFGNELFDQWLNQRSLEILGKIEKEKISNEDMMILSLKAQTNHFHHMDEEFRGEFKRINERIEEVEKKVDERFDEFDKKTDKRFDELDKKTDKRFDRLMTVLMWQGGILATLISGLYYKLLM